MWGVGGGEFSPQGIMLCLHMFLSISLKVEVIFLKNFTWIWEIPHHAVSFQCMLSLHWRLLGRQFFQAQCIFAWCLQAQIETSCSLFWSVPFRPCRLKTSDLILVDRRCHSHHFYVLSQSADFFLGINEEKKKKKWIKYKNQNCLESLKDKGIINITCCLFGTDDDGIQSHCFRFGFYGNHTCST